MSIIIPNGTDKTTVNNWRDITPATVDTPEDASVGDVVFCYISGFFNFGTITAPSGWTAVEPYYNDSSVSSSASVALYYRVIEEGDPSSYSWAISSTVNRNASFLSQVYSRIDSTSVLDVIYARADHYNSAGNTTSITPKPIETESENSSVLVFYGVNSSSNTVTDISIPAEFTHDADYTGSFVDTIGVMRKGIDTPAIESPSAITSDTAGNIVSITVALKASSSIYIDNVEWEPATGWNWQEYDGSLIPTDSILHINSGTHTGSDGAATLTDSSKSYTVDALVGLRVRNTVTGATGIITANTATTITATLSSGTWSEGDTYYIEIALDSGDQMVYEKTTNLGGSVVLNSKGVPVITGITGTHTFDIKYRDATDNKASDIRTVTVTVS